MPHPLSTAMLRPYAHEFKQALTDHLVAMNLTPLQAEACGEAAFTFGQAMYNDGIRIGELFPACAPAIPYTPKD